VWRRAFDERKGTYVNLKVPTCPTCGAVVEEKDRFCEGCQSPLFNFARWRRVGLSRLVQRKFRHFFKVYIGDEIHKCQNGRSDIGAADQRFISSIRYSQASFVEHLLVHKDNPLKLEIRHLIGAVRASQASGQVDLPEADDLRSLAVALEIERMIREGRGETAWPEDLPWSVPSA